MYWHYQGIHHCENHPWYATSDCAMFRGTIYMQGWGKITRESYPDMWSYIMLWSI